jgi:hypothetical protein
MKKIIKRLAIMGEPAYSILKGCLLISCALLLGAAVLHLLGDGFSATTYPIYYCAKEMAQLPAAILLIATIGSVIVEDVSLK